MHSVQVCTRYTLIVTSECKEEMTGKEPVKFCLTYHKKSSYTYLHILFIQSKTQCGQVILIVRCDTEPGPYDD